MRLLLGVHSLAVTRPLVPLRHGSAQTFHTQHSLVRLCRVQEPHNMRAWGLVSSQAGCYGYKDIFTPSFVSRPQDPS
jgi:hypothetical protein